MHFCAVVVPLDGGQEKGGHVVVPRKGHQAFLLPKVDLGKKQQIVVGGCPLCSSSLLVAAMRQGHILSSPILESNRLTEPPVGSLPDRQLPPTKKPPTKL
jgi:hypothetical protein